MPSLGNTTVIPWSESETSPVTAQFTHDNDKDDLLVFAIGMDAATNVATADFSASYNFATMTTFGETETGMTDDVPRIEVFFLQDAADGPNLCEVTFDVGANNLNCYIVIAISVSDVSQIGDVAVNSSDTPIQTITASLDIQESGSLVLAVGAFQDGSRTLSEDAAYTPLQGGTLTTGTDDRSDIVALLQSFTTAATGALDADVSIDTLEDTSILAVELRPAAEIPTGPELTLAESFVLKERPVFMVDFRFPDGDINVWTRPFPGEHDGRIYSPISGLTGSLAVRQSLDSPPLDIGARIVGNSVELKNAALTQDFQQRTATIRLGNIEDDGTITDEILLEGKMQDIPIVSDPEEGLSLAVIIESIFADINTPRDLRLSAADQKLIDPNDTFFNSIDTATLREPQFGG